MTKSVSGSWLPWLLPLVFLARLVSADLFFFSLFTWIALWSAAWSMAYRRVGRSGIRGALLGLLTFAVMLLLSFAEAYVWNWRQHDPFD